MDNFLETANYKNSFRNHLEKLDNIYDLMALCGVYIFMENEKEPYDFQIFDADKYNRVSDALEEYCSAKKDRGKKRAFEELREFLSVFFNEEINAEKCFAIIYFIDDMIEPEPAGFFMGNSGITDYCSMNGQYYDKIRIIPKGRENFFSRKEAEIQDSYELPYRFLRERRKCPCSVLDRETLNYMIWDEERSKRFPFRVYHIPGKHVLSKHFQESGKLVFGIIPFTDKPIDEIFDIQYKRKIFEITGMKPGMEEHFKERYQAICKKCMDREIDFLIFPELFMTDDILESGFQAEKYGSPWLIINGSIWKELVNKTYLTDRKGKRILSYCKKEPFLYKGKYEEHLDRSKNREYAILDIEQFGRIGICICKDLVNEDVKMFHKQIGTNLLLVPSFSRSMDLASGAEELAKDFHCIVVVANACAALEGERDAAEKRPIGFVSLPAKYHTNRTEEIMMYYRDECMETCQKICMGKMISIDFEKLCEYPTCSSYTIEQSTL